MVTTAGPASVLRLITRLNVGGPARQALLLTRELAADYPTILAAGTPSPEEGEMSDPAVEVRHLPLLRPLRPPADVHAVLAVRRLLNQARPKIVHTHMAKAGAVGRSAAWMASPRPRTVHTFHGHVLDGYFSPSTERAFIEIERRLARRTDVLVAVSAEIRDALLDLRIGRADQFHVIPLGLDLTAHLAVAAPTGELRRALRIGDDVPLVASIGRLVPIKDHDTMLAAIARLPGVHLAVVGDGELRARLEAKSREMGLEPRVHFTGWRTDVAAVLSDVDAVVLTSRNEGTPVALIEAAACARPAVATDVGGVSRVVVDGVTGYLARRSEADEVAALLGRLFADPSARLRMGAAAREHVRERFSHERLLHDIRDLYADLSSARVR